MARVPIAVGDAEAQANFLKEHQAFLIEHEELHRLFETVFCRQLNAPPDAEVERIRRLPDSDPEVLEFDNKVLADRIVFYLGRIAADDFGELLVLSGNARGIGAYKILRGMYERVVTMAYIAKNPSEARPFADDVAIKKWKLWSSILEVAPESEGTVPEEVVKALENEFQEAHAKRKESFCHKCGQPKTQDAWTRADLLTMARKTDPQLAVLYGSCYLDGSSKRLFQAWPGRSDSSTC